jgi:hypothetical protein
MIPDFVDGVNLPPGGHPCSWDELVDRFGCTPPRQTLCAELLEFINRAKDCGFVSVAIGGSFPTAKDGPGDLDLLFVVPPGTCPELLHDQCKELLDSAMSRVRFGHDFMFCPNQPETLEHLIL